MTKRGARDKSNAVGLFPFLAVLLCTMGALLVLLVVLAQRAGQRVAAERTPQAESESTTDLQRKLELVRSKQRDLQRLREQQESILVDQQQRLAHLEEHTRRLEHELAELSLAAQQLEATELDQSVDNEQAERELKRLQQLISDTEKQLEDQREQAATERSFAIVPYQGQNGTHRRPIYIECSAEGIILQPEGIRFHPSDFANLSWPGNPLAAALRASREFLIAKSARAGEPQPPDPYPLILVRPDGIHQYLAARRAINSWDSDFGYEFIDGDWKLEFPDLPDPQLARAQQHAVMVARERLTRLAQAAPRRFRGVSLGNGSGGGSAHSEGAGYGYGNHVDKGSPDRYSLAQAGGGNSAVGDSSAVGEEADSTAGSANSEHQYGALSGDASQGNSTERAHFDAQGRDGQSADGTGRAPGGSGTYPGQSDSLQEGTAQASNGQGQAGGPSTDSPAGPGSPTGASGQPGNPGGTGDQGTPSLQFTAPPSSIAESRGSDWAIQRAMRGSVPIRRPIQVVVRQNQVALLPSRHTSHGTDATGVVISLAQPMNRVSDDLVAAVKTRIEEWGLAGNGLYWRPVLELHVGPDARETASNLARLLENSGVEVRLPETARSQ